MTPQRLPDDPGPRHTLCDWEHYVADLQRAARHEWRAGFCLGALVGAVLLALTSLIMGVAT
jgi:hypothetical protein